MPAPKENTNAEKWTLEKINKFIVEVYEYVSTNKKCTTLIKATLECGEYESVLRYFKTLELNIDFTPIKKAKDIIKDRIIDNGLNNEYNPTMSIFILKNNHGMKDKSEVKQTNIDKTNLSELTYDELLDISKGSNPGGLDK